MFAVPERENEITDGIDSWCLGTPRRQIKTIKDALKNNGWLDRDLQIMKGQSKIIVVGLS